MARRRGASTIVNMNPIATSVIVLACVFGGALAGLFLRIRLPDQHLQDDSKDIVKLGIGVIATMAALVLGLLVSSAKDSFDRTSVEVTLGAAKIVQLNHALAQYGDETKEIRGALRRYVEAAADALGLDAAARQQLLSSGAQLIYKNRAGWAHDRLKRAGLSDSPRRGW